MGNLETIVIKKKKLFIYYTLRLTASKQTFSPQDNRRKLFKPIKDKAGDNNTASEILKTTLGLKKEKVDERDDNRTERRVLTRVPGASTLMSVK